MYRGQFAPEEWYHCYTRGIDHRTTFTVPADYERFLQLLYLCNCESTLHRSNLKNPSLEEVLNIKRRGRLVGIGAFCLMPNHFHLLLKEVKEGGISKFMQKVGGAYAMYFNIKHERVGNLFIKPFRSKHIADDDYLQTVINYIHCNPAELFEPKWKDGEVCDMDTLEKKLLDYPHSSFSSFTDPQHILRQLLDESIFQIETQSKPTKMLEEARSYYETMAR